MGYTTDFYGQFKFSRQLTDEEKERLDKVCDTDWRDFPESGAPGYYCQWTYTEDGWGLCHDGGEKFYDYVEWLEWLINHFFAPRDIVLNGELEWDGEEKGDVGKIIVKDNVVTVKEGKIVYE